jgi:hypothetical protein
VALVTEAIGNESAEATDVEIPAGALVVVSLRERDGSTMAVSDSVHGSYGDAVASAPVTIGRSQIFAVQNHPGGTADFAVTGGSQRDYNVAVFDGAATSGGADDDGAATSSATTALAHGAIDPSGPAIVVTALVGNLSDRVVTPHDGFTALATGETGGGSERQYYAYKLGHTGPINPTHTVDVATTTNACCVAFLEAAGGGFQAAWAQGSNVLRNTRVQ